MLRVVGWWPEIMRSPSSWLTASGLSNVTHTRSRSSHHGRSLMTWARCPPDEQTNITL